jgi:hypothetical protein
MKNRKQSKAVLMKCIILTFMDVKVTALKIHLKPKISRYACRFWQNTLLLPRRQSRKLAANLVLGGTPNCRRILPATDVLLAAAPARPRFQGRSLL